MVRITEDLVRKRAEHNEMEISTLEELSLHQQDIEKIEFLDKWCRDLKILYLQSNLIEKIENVSRLKKLEYLNLALNNITKIENLEGCESLQKLDFTVNFIGELTSIKSLKCLEFLRELYLTGNPCTDFEGYREYVIATLPQLQKLDGIDIEKSERIQAVQNYLSYASSIEHQEKDYCVKMSKEKENKSDLVKESSNENENGATNKDDEKLWDQKNKQFWEEKVPFTPDSRKQVHEHMKKARERGGDKVEEEPKRERPFFSADGRALNINEAKVDFTLTDDEENNRYVLDISAFKHMDTSLMDADVNPHYVRVLLKGKIFQLCLDEEVDPGSSTAQRATTTGHLVISMPKAKEIITTKMKDKKSKDRGEPGTIKSSGPERLEVDPKRLVDFANIIREKPNISSPGSFQKKLVKPRENSPDFTDDPDVPPLI